jgi:hypothetical protein
MNSGIPPASGSLVGLLAEQVDAANKILGTSQAIMDQLVSQGIQISLPKGKLDAFASSQFSSPGRLDVSATQASLDVTSSPEVARNLCRDAWQTERLENGDQSDIGGLWLMMDSKTKTSSKYFWQHVPGTSTFTGKQLGIGCIREGRLDGNDISWRVGHVRCEATITQAGRLRGQYFGSEGKLGDFTGESQANTEMSQPMPQPEKPSSANTSPEKVMTDFKAAVDHWSSLRWPLKKMSDFKAAVEQIGVWRVMSQKTSHNFSGAYEIVSGGVGMHVGGADSSWFHIAQDGNAITATSSSGSWTGAVCENTICMFGITGTMSNGMITWSNGMVWVFQSRSLSRKSALTEPLLDESRFRRFSGLASNPRRMQRMSQQTHSFLGSTNLEAYGNSVLSSPTLTPRMSLLKSSTSSNVGASRVGDLKRRTSKRSSNLFVDPDAIMAMTSTKSEYHVESLYHETGICQAIARNGKFEYLTFAIIVFNAIWIGVATDCNKATILINAPEWIQIGENSFCTFFTFELLVRFSSFKRKMDALHDGWFRFDLSLVLMMAYETWGMVLIYLYFGAAHGGAMGNVTVLRILRLTRLTRLTRIARVARLIRDIPQLSILFKAISLAVTSVGATLIFLFTGIYIFAIFFVQILGDTKEGKAQFVDVPTSFNTLLVYGIFDQSTLLETMSSTGSISYAATLFYVFIVGMTITDMMIGIITDTVSSVAKAEKDALLKDHFNEVIEDILQHMDEDGSNTISHDEFHEMLQNPNVNDLMLELEVDVEALVNCTGMIFQDETEELSLDKFIDILLGFRHSNPVYKDKLELRRFLTEQLQNVESSLEMKLNEALHG